jgi:hypothetical protein
MTAIDAVLDGMLRLFVPKVRAAAACPTERYHQKCYCDPRSALVYYRWCTVQTTCAVKCGPCWASDIRCV